MYDVIIVGAGPAGVSAGLYAKRANKEVLILYYGEANLEKAHMIDNYYGFENGISGKALYENGIKQAQNLGIDVRKEEVLHIAKNANFEVKTELGEYEGKTLILATGNKKLRPNIKGVLEFEGKGISYCAICDGFFYRKKNVVVIGNGKFAISEAGDLKNIANNVKILTNGEELESEAEFEVIQTKITEIKGDTKVRSIEFEDGTSLEVDGVFIALGEAGGADFAKKIGVLTSKGDNIIVNENMETNVKGLYACGNSTGGLLQVSKAVYEGAKAGLTAANYKEE
ncbi:MAG: NAD(P)/FAD-dependent oxidoreductase [Clostridia bacterium]|nr:NAD(P)/FAD-dependent oxidoreductase [Clostridia bacterium]